MIVSVNYILGLKHGLSGQYLWVSFFIFFFVGWRVGVGVVSSSTVQGTIAYLMHDIQDMASSLRVVCLSSYGIGAAGAHRCLQRVQQGFAITTHLNKTQHFAVTVSQLQPVLFTC